MLIRLVSHPTDNPLHIDKMIVLNGLPEKMVFDVRNGIKFLKEPWKPDFSENIPKDIRKKFGAFKVWLHLPPPEKGMPDVNDELEVYALTIDFQNGQGEQLWKQIERMIDMSTPRDERLPAPVLVAKNRIENFSLDAEDIPVVEFGERTVAETPKEAMAVKGTGLRCPVCNKTFERDAQMRMHKARTGHRESQVVAA